MQYRITHLTTYSYETPVMLGSHVVRLRPRCDLTQSVQQFSLEVFPTPLGRADNVDLDGNGLYHLWFEEVATSQLLVKMVSVVETYRDLDKIFAYLLAPEAIAIPVAYSSSELLRLQPYLHSYCHPGAIDATASQLAQSIWDQAQGNTLGFLSTLNQTLYKSCQYMWRETGDPYPPGLTWTQKQGSCRDLAVLFMEVCRSVGLACRFISGYHEVDPEHPEAQLHAWVEVYLPGGGWRGYDPTQGLAVSDRHIALVAAPHPRDASPIQGMVKQGGVSSQMNYHLTVETL